MRVNSCGGGGFAALRPWAGSDMIQRLSSGSTFIGLRPLASIAASCVALAVAGCGELDIRVIETLPPPPPMDRGRVQVRDGNLLTDKGTRLRGLTLGVDTQPDLLLTQDTFERMSHELGLNAFHVYLENYGDETGVHEARGDELVEMTSAAGLYLVIGIGGGDANGSFDLEKVRSFWSHYAPRYAARTHVLFEIQNNPDVVCDGPYSDETLAMQREIYELIRAAAPSTHVALFSFMRLPSGAALAANLDALADTVDWSKASVAFHLEPCAGTDNLPALLEVVRERRIAAFNSELPYSTPFDGIARLESERVGWFNFEWIVRTRDLMAFKTAYEDAGLSWCPDFGSWPQDSESCSTP